MTFNVNVGIFSTITAYLSSGGSLVEPMTARSEVTRT